MTGNVHRRKLSGRADGTLRRIALVSLGVGFIASVVGIGADGVLALGVVAGVTVLAGATITAYRNWRNGTEPVGFLAIGGALAAAGVFLLAAHSADSTRSGVGVVVLVVGWVVIMWPHFFEGS